MMKNIYIKPTTVVVCFDAHTLMLSASNPQASVDPDVDPVNPEEIESRQASFDLWEDD